MSPAPRESSAANVLFRAFPTFVPTLKPKHPKGKLHGKKLKTGVTVGCPTGGPSCTFSFTLKAKGAGKLGKGSLTLAAGSSQKLVVKLKHKPGHHHKLKLVMIAADGTGAPVTFSRTIKL